MEKSNVMKSFIQDEIVENKFSGKEINLFYTCIEATGCIYTASELVSEKIYNEYLPYIDSYIELADTLVYKSDNISKDNYLIKELQFLLSRIKIDGNVYMPTLKEELEIETYLKSYGWIVNEEYDIAVNLDINYIDSSQLRLVA